MCLKSQVPHLMFRASHHRQKGWKSLGRRRRGGSELRAVRLEAVKGGEMQEVLLSQVGVEYNWKRWKLQRL